MTVNAHCADQSSCSLVETFGSAHLTVERSRKSVAEFVLQLVAPAHTLGLNVANEWQTSERVPMNS